MARNILFVESGLGSGGSSNYLWYFLKYLDRKIFNPIVLFYKQCKGPDIEKIRDLGIEVQFLNSNGSTKDRGIADGSDGLKVMKELLKILGIKSLLKFFHKLLFNYIPQAIRLKTFLKEKDINLIFLNNDLHYHIPSVVAAKWVKIPCICRKAGIGGGRIIKRIFHPWVTFFIASSDGATRDYKLERLPEDKMTRIYEGIDISRFNPLIDGVAIRQQLDIPSDSVVICTSARIAPGKGQFELIDAIPRIVEKCPYVRFIIVGDDVEGNGRLLNELKKKAETLNISEYIRFTGWRTDIPELLGASDIFVHNPNAWLEALGIATLEAMAMGKPTIVTNNWGLAETTEDGVTGYVIPPNDPNALVEAITDLASDPEKFKEMGKKARERAEALFDIKKNVKVTEKIILRILEDKHSAVSDLQSVKTDNWWPES